MFMLCYLLFFIIATITTGNRTESDSIDTLIISCDLATHVFHRRRLCVGPKEFFENVDKSSFR